MENCIRQDSEKNGWIHPFFSLHFSPHLFFHGNLDLHDIILHPVNDGFIDSLFIGIAGKHQPVASGPGEEFLIPQGDPAPVSFVKGFQIGAVRLDVKTVRSGGGRVVPFTGMC